MPPHRLRRAPTTRIGVLVGCLALALALALLMAGCGGVPDKPKAGGKTPSATGSGEPDPGKDEPATDPGYQAPRMGQCYRLTPAQSLVSVASGKPVSCRGKHTSVVSYVGFVPKPVTAGTSVAKRRALGMRVCAPAYRRVVGGTLADRATSILTWTLFTPDQLQLERGARWVRCDVLARSGDQLVALPAGKSALLGRGVPAQLRICQNESGADVSCSSPHAYRVEAVFRAVGEHYPDLHRYAAVARDRCDELTDGHGGYWQPPGRGGWEAGDRFIRCLSPQK
jgi:hypothetical protein